MRTDTTRKQFLAKMIGLIAAAGFVAKSSGRETNQPTVKLPSSSGRSMPFTVRPESRAIARREGSV